MTHRYYADPIFAPYRNAVAEVWCRLQQSYARCWSCWRRLVDPSGNFCRCGGGDA